MYELSLFYISHVQIQASLCITTKPEDKEEYHIARVWLFWILQKNYPPQKLLFSRLITMHHFNIQVEFFLDILTHEDKITMFHCNIGSQLLSDTVSYSRKMDASATPLWKPYNSQLKNFFFLFTSGSGGWVPDFVKMDLSLDAVYRAVLRGMQIGLGSAFILILVKNAVTLPGLQKISPLAMFCTGMLLGIAFAFYRDCLKVRM